MSRGEKTKTLWKDDNYRKKMIVALKKFRKNNPQPIEKMKKMAKKRWKGHIKTKYKYKYQPYKKKYPNGATERKKFTNQRYKARKKNAEGSHTFGEWELLKKQYGYTCPMCGKKEPEIKLTEDHIIPLSRGGSDYVENIQPLCINCNIKKHTKIIKFNPIDDNLNKGGKGE